MEYFFYKVICFKFWRCCGKKVFYQKMRDREEKLTAVVQTHARAIKTIQRENLERFRLYKSLRFLD